MKPMLWPMLGAVRFYLALAVAASHLDPFCPGNRLERWFDDMGGLAAVLGFLIISGFSIAASEAKQPEGFYRRRLLRIMPLYVLALVASYACVRGFGGAVRATNGEVFVAPTGAEWAKNLFFLQGFVTSSLKTNPVIWTLSVEVFFYVLAPVLARLSQPALAAIGLGALALFLAALPFHLPSFAELRGGAAAALLGWAWLAGFIAFRQKDRLKAALAVLAITLAALDNYAGFLAVHWSLSIVLVCAAIGFGGRLKAPPAVAAICTRLGDASYPLYLFHLPVYLTMSGWGLKRPALVFLGAAVAAAVALDRLLDQPLKRLIRRAGKHPALGAA
jgi:peptidoglycan/LPS O-acetylase OafA/YrhL